MLFSCLQKKKKEKFVLSVVFFHLSFQITPSNFSPLPPLPPGTVPLPLKERLLQYAVICLINCQLPISWIIHKANELIVWKNMWTYI